MFLQYEYRKGKERVTLLVGRMSTVFSTLIGRISRAQVRAENKWMQRLFHLFSTSEKPKTIKHHRTDAQIQAVSYSRDQIISLLYTCSKLSNESCNNYEFESLTTESESNESLTARA